MNEALENAWKEFERTGEIANSADELLGYATRLTEENAKLRELLHDVMECVNQDLWDTRCDDAKQLLTELNGQNNDK